MQPSLRLGVVILGAGASSRMGRPKLLLSWRNTSVIGHLWRQWRELGAERIVVVCRRSDTALHDELDRLRFPMEHRVFNPNPDREMFSSIQCAAAWSGWDRTLSHTAISLGDQPHLKLETLRRLLEFATAHTDRICQPSFQGRAKHPVVLPARAFREITAAPEEHLKQFLQNRRHQIAPCEMDDPGLDFDMDTPADYERSLLLNEQACKR